MLGGPNGRWGVQLRQYWEDVRNSSKYKMRDSNEGNEVHKNGKDDKISQLLLKDRSGDESPDRPAVLEDLYEAIGCRES